MEEVLKAIRYKSLDEATGVLSEIAPALTVRRVTDDGGSEPQGLLAVIAEDRLPEEVFYRLFDARKGVLVEVERVPFSGFGPPAREDDYMGYPNEGVAYILKGCRLAIEINDCPQNARDFHQLEALVEEGRHPLNRPHLASQLGFPEDWEFEDLFDLVMAGQYSADELDRLIHLGIQ